MPALNTGTSIRVISKGFALLRDKEKEQDRRITMDSVSRDTGLAKMTVRRFLAQGSGDVSGSPLGAAAAIANYLGVELGDLLEVKVQNEEAQ